MIRAGLWVSVVTWLMASTSAPWGDLSGWLGRYPTDRDAKPPRSLLMLPALRAELGKLLTAADLAKLASFAVERPVEMEDGLLIVGQCMPHDCGEQHAMVVIDPKQPRLWVGFFSRSSAAVSTRWFGATDHRLLPGSVLRRFDAQHPP